MTPSENQKVAVEALVALASHASPPGEGRPDAEIRDPSYRWFLGRHGSAVLLDGSLRLFGSSPSVLPSATEWNRSSWRQDYGTLCPEDVSFFGEDVLGNQFAFSRDGVIRFDVETGAKDPVASNFGDFARRVVADPDEFSNRWLANRWMSSGGAPIDPNQHLVPRVPFIAGGEFDSSNLYLLDRYESMSLRAQVAVQIMNLPDGSQIRLVVK